jgi:hypothetical protein
VAQADLKATGGEGAGCDGVQPGGDRRTVRAALVQVDQLADRDLKTNIRVKTCANLRRITARRLF